MGSGKTSWAIQYMNGSHESEKFIYITPFLNEVERVKREVTNKEFVEPEKFKGKNKREHFKTLLSQGKNICSTHALFKKADEALIDLIQVQGYTLILDEVMNVIEQEPITKEDLQHLTQPNHNGEPLLYVKPDGTCRWTKKDYKGRFESIKELAESNNLMIHNNTALYWTMPVRAFRAFEQVIVMTYMFDGQLQKYYYDMHDVDYYYKAIKLDPEDNRYKLINYVDHTAEDREHLRELINIHYSKLNDIGKGYHAFSSTKLDKYANDSAFIELKERVKKDAYNFYRNKIKASAKDVMWTTIKGENDSIKKALAPHGLTREYNEQPNKFVEVTARATNDYKNKTTCIYLANRYLNPMLKQFVEDGGAKVDQDKFALSELLQWIFRSRIRVNQPIDIYIPSSRMRRLLEQYLNNEI